MVVAFHAATLATGRALPLTRTGLSPVGTRQLSWRTKGRHFEAPLILQAVSWYLRYSLGPVAKFFRARFFRELRFVGLVLAQLKIENTSV